MELILPFLCCPFSGWDAGMICVCAQQSGRDQQICCFRGGFQVFLTGNLLRFISMWTGTVKPESTAGFCEIKTGSAAKAHYGKASGSRMTGQIRGQGQCLAGEEHTGTLMRQKEEKMNQNTDILYIVIPAYNEEENINQVIDDWYPVIEKHSGGGKSRLVIIDDGSKDQTYHMIRESAKDKPLLLPLTKGNEGHGATVLFGYQYALDAGAEYIFQTDSDGQTLPEEFSRLWSRRKKYDVVMGHRKNREDGFSRVIVTKVLKFVLWIVFGLKITDANTPYRLMKREVLKKYIVKVPEKFNLSNVLLTVFFVNGEEKIAFVPITFRPRQGGVNSINIPKIIKIGIQALKDFAALRKVM